MSEAEVVKRLIIPPQETETLIAQAGKIYLRDCPCRAKMQECPREKWEVCLLFEHASAEERQQAREITLEEALRIVRVTTGRGDIHQVFYFVPERGGFVPERGGFVPARGGFVPARGGFVPARGGFVPARGGFVPARGGFVPARGGFVPAQGGLEDGARPYELCNCCTCCCFPLRKVKEKGNYAQEPRCDYLAVTDAELCVGCGACLDSCMFEARQLGDDGLFLIDERCFGCGRCLASCPEGAIQIGFQAGRGVPIPSF